MRQSLLAIAFIYSTFAYGMDVADEDSLRGIGGGYSCATQDEIDLSFESKQGEISIPQEVIREVFQRNGGRLNAIYQNELRGNECTSGTLLLRIMLNGDGKVIDVDYRASNQAISRIGGEVINAVKEFRFPSSRDGKKQEFSYMLNFFRG